MFTKWILFLSVLFLYTPAFSYTSPDWKFSPGILCTPQDPNFQKYDYSEHIARCARNVDEEEKRQVAEEYGGIPKSEWRNYEFDHIIPLCAGGSNDIGNLWPQPIDEAHEKDKIEDAVCKGLRAGIMTQDQAVKEIYGWFGRSLYYQ